MTISLTKEQEAHLNRLVKEGKFNSAEHFVNYSLHVADVEDTFFEDEIFVKRVKAALAEAQDDIDNGRVHSFSKEDHQTLIDEVHQRGIERLKNGQSR